MHVGLASSSLPLSLPPSSENSLELDFDALDDELSESGDLKEGSPSVTPSPPLMRNGRGLTENGLNSSNLDLESSGGSRDNLAATSNHIQSGSGVGAMNGVGRTSDKEATPDTPSEGLSISLGSLDLDFSTTSFGLGTISEGRSLMNIPITTSASSSSSTSGDSPAAGKGSGGLLRSVSHQPLDAAAKTRKLSYQPPKRQAPPQVAPKPRRGSYSPATHPAPPSLQVPSNNARPVNPKVGRQSSEMMPQRMSPQQARKEMMKSTPALFPSPPRTRRNTDSLPRNTKGIMTPLLSFQAQQELREAAKQIKQESKKSSNGVIPQMQQGSPILLRRGATGTKQPSPPLPYRSTNGAKQSPKHVPAQRISPPSSRQYAHLSPGMKGSSSMTRLSPSVSRAQEETTISRNSSIDSGIQYSSEGENGGGVAGETARNASTSSSGVGSTTSESTNTASSGVGGGGNKLAGSEKKPGEGLGDFSDLLSVIANMGGGDSFFS